MASSLQLMKCGWNLIHGTNVETFFTSGRTPSAVRKLFEDLSIYLKEHLGEIASTWVYFITDDHNTLTICQLESTELNVSVIKSIQMFTNQTIKIRIESKDCTKLLMADLRIETVGNLKLLIRRVVGAALCLGCIAFEPSPITSPTPASAPTILNKVPNLGLKNLVVGSGGDKDIANMEDVSDTETMVSGNTNTSKRALETSRTHTTASPLQTDSEELFRLMTPGYAGTKITCNLEEGPTVQNISRETETTVKLKSISKLGNELDITIPVDTSSIATSKGKRTHTNRRLIFEVDAQQSTGDSDIEKENQNMHLDSDEDVFKRSLLRKSTLDPESEVARKLVLDMDMDSMDSDRSKANEDKATTLEGSQSEGSEFGTKLKRKKFRKSIHRHSSSLTALKSCPKLKMVTQVHLLKMDAAILVELAKNIVIHVGISKSKFGRRKTDELDRAIQCLMTYDPIKNKQEVKKTKKVTSRRGPMEQNEMTAYMSTDDEDSDKTIHFNRASPENQILQKIREIDEDDPNKDDEGQSELDVGRQDSEQEDLARNTVLGLGFFRKKRKTSMTQKDLNMVASKQSYITPKPGFSRIRSCTESDGSSDSPSRRKLRSRKKLKYDDYGDSRVKKEIISVESYKEDSDDSDFVNKLRKNRRKLPSSKDKESAEVSELMLLDSHSSEDDFKVKKPRRRKQKQVVESSTDDDRNSIARKKVRPNIASDQESSDVKIVETDSDIQEIPNDSQSPSKGRKNIRKVMDEKELTKSTRQAAKDEEERKKRLSEKQKQFNSCFSPPQSDVIQQLVLDFDENTKIPLVSVDPEVVKKLKPHQAKGIQFMWNTCFESLNKKGEGGGCILAHCMGLGKTLQTVAFLHTVLSHKDVEIKSALIICPLNTVGNWYSEFQMWLKNVSKRISLHRLYEYAGKRRIDALEDWKRSGGVGIIHYDSFRTLANAVNPPPVKSKGKAGSRPIKQMFSQRELKLIEDVLLNPGPGIVVCDEGHLLKNAASKLTSAVGNFKTQRRIVLTGTPLQNNLVEYHTMMNFVKPNLLGNTKEFANRFVHPITNGQHKDSDELDVKLMKRRAHVLHKILDGCVQRLDYSVLTPYLPPKLEYAIFINLSELQKNMYAFYINNITSNANTDRFQASKLLADKVILSKIWTHPKILTYKDKAKTMDKNKRAGSGYDSEGSLKDFIDDGESSELEVGVGTGDDNIEVLGTAGPSAKAKNGPVAEIGTLPNVEKPAISPVWYKTFLTKEVMDSIEVSGKLIVLKNILEASADIGDKILVFSQYLTTLDFIEELLEQMDKKADKVISFPTLLPSKEKVGRWRANFEYFRIDGSTKTEDRKKQCDTFNIKTATRAKLFLISTKAGGLGINLVGANRVVIFDASWNPSQDLQSIFRVYRFGQVKPCYVYRLIARGTMEEIIYNRQVVKLSLSCRVVDEQQIERHYQYEEIKKMYQFNPNDAKERPVPIVPKDRLLGELLMSQENWIFSYLEHDSLLENQEEEELTKEERQAAWNDYQNNEGQIQRTGLTTSEDSEFRVDDWVIKSANYFKTYHTDLSESQILSMAREAKLEVQRLIIEWDVLHDPTLGNVDRVFRQGRFDQLFKNLNNKFGPEAGWEKVLRPYPSSTAGPSSLISTLMTNGNLSAPALMNDSRNGASSAINGNTNAGIESGRPPYNRRMINRRKPQAAYGPIINPGSVMTLNGSVNRNGNGVTLISNNVLPSQLAPTLPTLSGDGKTENPFIKHSQHRRTKELLSGPTVSASGSRPVNPNSKRIHGLSPQALAQQQTELHSSTFPFGILTPSASIFESSQRENQMVPTAGGRRPSPVVINRRPVNYIPLSASAREEFILP